MKIVFDHQIFLLQRYGGISRYFCELATQLAKNQECKVGIVAPLHINEYLRESGPPVNVIAGYIGNVPKTRRIAAVANRRLAEFLISSDSPDIVHRTYYDSSLPKVKSARTVITVYDMIHERLQPFMEGAEDAVGKRAAVAAADHVICISESTRRDLVEIFGIDQSKISVVYLGFDLMPVSDELTLGISTRAYILYVGQRWGYKNFDGLLSAYASSPRLRENFDVICFGGGPLSGKEKSDIAKLGIREHAVRQIGGSDGVLRKLYQQAAIFVYPSLYEGFGIPPLEAMSFDCPVVCCAVSSMPEVVGNAASFFEAGNNDSLRAAIERVLDDSTLRLNLIKQGRARLKLFSWQRCAMETFKIYQRVLT